MKLTEAEMRMVFQIESTNQNAALNEIYMTWRYAPNPATKETAESLLEKLRPLSDQECMDIIRKVQAEYRLPEKARTIGEMLAEARQQSGAQKLSGHDIMALERFDPATRHMIVFDVLTHDSPVGWKGEKMRLFLTDAGYSKALENQEKGHIKVRSHAKVLSGDLHYDHTHTGLNNNQKYLLEQCVVWQRLSEQLGWQCDNVRASYNEISQAVQNEVYAGAKAFVKANKGRYDAMNVAVTSTLAKDRTSDSSGRS